MIKLTPNAVTKRAAQLNRNLRREVAIEELTEQHTGKMRQGEIIQLNSSAFATFPLHPEKNP